MAGCAWAEHGFDYGRQLTTRVFVINADADLVEHGFVEELSGFGWALFVELASPFEQAEHELNSGLDDLVVLGEGIESALGRRQLLGQVVLFGLEGCEVESLSEVGVEESLLGSGQPGDFLLGGCQLATLHGAGGGDLLLHGCAQFLGSRLTHRHCVPESRDATLNIRFGQVRQVAGGALLGLAEAEEVGVGATAPAVVAVAEP